MSAERKIQSGTEAVAEQEFEPFALKEQVAARLAAHRNRRGRSALVTDPSETAPARERTSRIAATVAERYAHSQSYRSYLAEEAERAIRQAEAAAEVARLNAQAVAAAQYDLLEKLDEYAAEPAAPMLVPAPEPVAAIESAAQPVEFHAAQLDLAPTAATAPLTVRLAEEIRLPDSEALDHTHRQHAREVAAAVSLAADPDELFSLDEEIAFRQAPVFEPLEPVADIPANLIEFPRQLVAPRRARPRLAEGPLRDEAPEQDSHQLRIFEVEADQLSFEPVAEAAAPEWSSILLDAQPRSSTTVYEAAHASYHPYQDSLAVPIEYATAGDRLAQHLKPSRETQHLYAVPFKVAPASSRLMAGIVDATAILASFFLFAAVAIETVSRMTPGGLQLTLGQFGVASAAVLVLLSFGYQYLFFSFSDATPGMRYARIGLCTFSDDNPKREAMRGRVLALALATAPLGLGLIWSLFDADRLGWHDRISRMYPRSY